MGVQLSEIIEGEKHSQVLWNGKIINFAYDPNKYTAQAEAEWNRIINSGWAGDMVCSFIERLLISWDLQGDVEWDLRDPTEEELEEDPDMEPQIIPGTGRVVPADHAFPLELYKLRFIPMSLAGDLVDQIQKDVEVGKEKKQRSSAGSNMVGTRNLRRVT